jgi:outer membrane protein TolC
LDALIAEAKENRPALFALDERARAARLAADQAAFDRRPDFSVWLGYRFRAEAGMDDGTDQMSIGAAIPIPFDYLGTTDAKRAAHLEQAKATEYQKSAVMDEIGTDIERSLAAWQRAYSKEKNYSETLVPAAQKTLESAMLAYETDRADFFSIYRSEVDLIEFERAIHSARMTTRRMKAKIETTIGKAIETVASSDTSGVSQ